MFIIHLVHACTAFQCNIVCMPRLIIIIVAIIVSSVFTSLNIICAPFIIIPNVALIRVQFAVIVGIIWWAKVFAHATVH